MKLLVLFLSSLLFAAPMDEKNLVSVELLAETATTQQRSPLSVGFYFKIQEGWHIYWKNPGDSGQPVRVTWELPEGFKASELKWPYPHRIQVKNIVNFGYEKTVLLPVEISSGSQKGMLKATVKWLACRDICVPGKSTVSLPLPPKKSNSALFQTALHQLPQLPPRTWKLSSQFDKINFRLHFQGVKGELGKAPAFFSDKQNVIDETAAQSFKCTEQECQLQLKASELLTRAPSALTGVLVSNDHAFEINVPVGTANP